MGNPQDDYNKSAMIRDGYKQNEINNSNTAAHHRNTGERAGHNKGGSKK